MRWYRLTEEERRACRAPAEIDALGMLHLTLFDRWRRDAIFVLVKTFVDESGVGGDPRIMLAGLVAKAAAWHGFNWHWKKLLKKEGIEYSHIVAMENSEPPFEDWGLKRTVPFVNRARKRIDKNCTFGLTVAANVSDYHEHYRGKLSDRTHKDGCYGVCARALIETVTLQCVANWGPDTIVNFVFEDNQHFEDARRIFRDLQDHVPELAPHLGQIAPGLKHEHGGLMAADLLASLGRRSEPTAVFVPVEPGPWTGKREDGHMRMYHVDMHPNRLLAFAVHSDEISREKRGRRRQRGFERWKQKKGY